MAQKVRRAASPYAVNPKGTPDQQDRARGAYPRKPAEDDPDFDPKVDGNKRGKIKPRAKIREYRKSYGQWS